MRLLLSLAWASLVWTPPLLATETEHLNFQVLPAPDRVAVDGKPDDWDLSGGVFACGNVEESASTFGVWFHAMHDAERLYLLARWVDPTPMNNPGSAKGDSGFLGDCLQARLVVAPEVTAASVANGGGGDKDAPEVRTSHLTCWRDRVGVDVIDIVYGHKFNEGGLKSARDAGAEQAFLPWMDGRGYNQEIALPWRLLAKPGFTPKPGDRLLLTIEPNFTTPTGGRLSIKDLFKPGVAPDRVFTFMGNGSWGYATLASEGRVAPRAVRLADGREFAVRLENGMPVADWTGVKKSRLPEGFKPIRFSLPEDGYVSLNLYSPDGAVARQLLTGQFFAKGEHEVRWDGLATLSFRRPGAPLPAGEYSWEGLWHPGIGLRLRGWAANSGPAPWQGWGADHGNPAACAAAGERVFVGWSAGEADKPLLACDSEGNIQWKNIRGGIAGASLLACDGNTVYAFNNLGGHAARAIYRVDAATGQYTEWSAFKSPDLTMPALWGNDPDAPQAPSGLAASGGRVFISFAERDTLFVVNARTGEVEKRLRASEPSALAAVSGSRVLVVCRGREVVSVSVEEGSAEPLVQPGLEGRDRIAALALDRAGSVYLGVRGDHHHVRVYDRQGRFLRRLGRPEGRPSIGPFVRDGMLNIGGLAIDARNQLWVAEDDAAPRRVSVWDASTGALKREFFGATAYGATGGAIDPQDPDRMVGQGCEWRLDPRTGRSVCLAAITRETMSSSRFGRGANGRWYLATSASFLERKPVRIFEHLGDGQWKPRTVLYPPEGKGVEFRVWSDANDDAQEQPEEVAHYSLDLGGWIAGWYLSMTPDLTFYGTHYRAPATGFTACGAPLYDFAKATRMAGPTGHRGGMGTQLGLGSADGRLMLYNGAYGEEHSTFDCYEIATGRLRWTYPNNFTGVHGSHRAGPAEAGLIRGAYDVAGCARLPKPVGGIWVIPTNKGEWHVLTERGFYLTRLFEGDPMKTAYPELAAPGAVLDRCPPGAGEEAFGGAIAQTEDGRLFAQVGSTSFWNVEVVGWEAIRGLSGGSLTLTPEDVEKARAFRERYLQPVSTARDLAAHRATPVFTGRLDRDFAGAELVRYEKEESTAVRTAVAWDDLNLYVGWEVKDPTPWMNGADAPEFMYARGDTVDLQLGLDPRASTNRSEPVLGDLRVSIGDYRGKPAVVVYRKEAVEAHPRSFQSGVIKDYRMASVLVVEDARVEVKVDAPNRRYTVEAALPWTTLGARPLRGALLRADFGATFGNPAGNDTVLRSYWSNPNTGLVSDEVVELQMNPRPVGDVAIGPVRQARTMSLPKGARHAASRVSATRWQVTVFPVAGCAARGCLITSGAFEHG